MGLRRSIMLLCLFLLSHTGNSQERILIAAASDLKFAMDSIITVFKKNHNAVVDVTYGSSGKLFQQISNGAPFQIFFSADTEYPEQLQKKGLIAGEPYTYGIGRIVLWSKRLDPRKQGMASLTHASVKKIAIANPVHAPYGKRAEEALRHYNLLKDTKSKLVYGENISQTAQFITSGAADIGIIALSLAVSPNMMKSGGSYFLIPESSHRPLEQSVVVIRHAAKNPVVMSFMEFIRTETSVKILAYFGFSKP